MQNTISPIVMNLSHVSKIWPSHDGASLQVLNELRFTISKGDIVAIIGPSGSGKSTLLSILAGLDKPTSGEVTVLGQDMTKMSESQLAKFRSQSLGIVFQQFHLMNTLTALENIRLPLDIIGRRDAETLARKYLEAVGLQHRENHLPKELSGGECQRVAIARALVTHPALVLADEPTGNLDPKTADQVANLLFDLAKREQMTLVLVTHNHDLAKRCDRRYVMRDGKLFADE
jgi:putative ABC transport system ATP-binding protein